VAIPPFAGSGDLPLGVHPAPLREVLARFAAGSAQRIAVGLRLERIHAVAEATVVGADSSFSACSSRTKAEPNDVDVFLLMEDSFDPALLTGEGRPLFDHLAAQAPFGASVFWLRPLFGGRAGGSKILAGKARRWLARHYCSHWEEAKIRNDQELEATQERIRHFQAQVRHLRKVEANPLAYRLSASGFLAEMDKMQLKYASSSLCIPVNSLQVPDLSSTSSRRNGKTDAADSLTCSASDRWTSPGCRIIAGGPPGPPPLSFAWS
jgi:hypothetical protein